jgi:RNA polymerase sigma factor (sigma-70 family)
MSSVAQPRTSQAPREGDHAWRERSTRLYEELRRPSAAMVRRAFGSTLDDHTIEDIYASAWLATLRALQSRAAELSDDEVRRYLLTAVARHAGKEMRRRKRRPVAVLDNDAIGDGEALPEERAEDHERSRITRDLLASLPRRRRAVLLLRYGWGLEPSQVCNLIDGLSPRAYRKEITRGIDQLTQQLRKLESGAWCADREPVLKAFAAGVADEEQRRQAEHHLAHCRHCADFVGKLSGHLHDLGSAAALPGAIDLAADGRLSIPDRLADVGDRMRETVNGLVGRAGQEAETVTSLPAGAPRGAGAAGAGVVAKLAGLGMAGKAAVACLGGGAVAAVCVASGVGPIHLGGDSRSHPAEEGVIHSHRAPATAFDVLPKEDPPSDEANAGDPEPPPPPEEPQPPEEPPPPTTTTTTPAVQAPPAVDQFGEIPAGGSGGGGSSGGGSQGPGDFDL